MLEHCFRTWDCSLCPFLLETKKFFYSQSYAWKNHYPHTIFFLTMCWERKSTLHVICRIMFPVLLLLWKGWLPSILGFRWILKASLAFTHLMPNFFTFEAFNIIHQGREGISIFGRRVLRSDILILIVSENFISFYFESSTINIFMSKDMTFIKMTIK